MEPARKRRKIESEKSQTVVQYIEETFAKRTCKNVIETQKEFATIMKLYKKQLDIWKTENDHKLGQFIFMENEWACSHVLSFLYPREICKLSRVNRHTNQ